MANHNEDSRRLFQGIAESLDISDTQYEAAKQHYEAVGDWLSKADSPIAVYEPSIYPQGSFRLGTVIRPINDTDEYDIDLVCELKSLRKARVTQKQLKHMIGDRLKASARYRKMLEEGNRCWKLHYADSAQFHMDVLPAVPDDDNDDLVRLVGANLVTGAILITDKELREWQRSNPVGYTEWFRGRMRIQFGEARRLLAQSMQAGIEDVPEYRIKTPLQRAIQILKRHRDIMFERDLDDKPISIIISTLAAHSYDNEADLLDALRNIVNGMPSYIEVREGVSWVSNPVNPIENFADKWQKHPQRETKFRKWLGQVRLDLDTALRKGDMRAMVESLKPGLGDRVMNEAASKAFPNGLATAGLAGHSAPRITIERPSKPWGG